MNDDNNFVIQRKVPRKMKHTIKGQSVPLEITKRHATFTIENGYTPKNRYTKKEED